MQRIKNSIWQFLVVNIQLLLYLSLSLIVIHLLDSEYFMATKIMNQWNENYWLDLLLSSWQFDFLPIVITAFLVTTIGWTFSKDNRVQLQQLIWTTKWLLPIIFIVTAIISLLLYLLPMPVIYENTFDGIVRDLDNNIIYTYQNPSNLRFNSLATQLASSTNFYITISSFLLVIGQLFYIKQLNRRLL